MRGYYSSFNKDTYQISFVPYTGSDKPSISQASSTPTQQLGLEEVNIVPESIAFSLQIVALIALLGFIGYLSWQLCFKSKQEVENNSEPADQSSDQGDIADTYADIGFDEVMDIGAEVLDIGILRANHLK